MKIETVNAEHYADFDHHERILRCTDEVTGLDAIIAIHNRNLGPALGGCRMWAYANHEAAITDVLRLSKGMTYKSALAGLPLGGGKSVINVAPSKKSDAMIEAMGAFVDSLGGDYIVAEDSGTSVSDMKVMARKSAHVAGYKEKHQSDGRVLDGDPSRSTAYGVFVGIRSAVAHKLGTDSLSGVHVAVQGVGHVGYNLAFLLKKAGAQLTIADINAERIQVIADELGAAVASVQDVHRTDCDVFAPCALGSVITLNALDEISAEVIAGAANNQLANDAAGFELFSRGKLFAPDYVINAGGIIDIYYERGDYDHDKVIAHIDRIGVTLNEIFETSRRAKEPTHVIADRLAEQRFMRQEHVDVA